LKKGKEMSLGRNVAKQTLFLKEIFLTTFILSILYASSDEFHQSFMVGRQGSLWDVLIDAIGIILGMYLFARWKLSRKN